jgi:type I site-specific restriction endonuclease
MTKATGEDFRLLFPAVQLGIATPKRQDNVDTYKYFGEPVYIYSQGRD